MGHFQKIRRRSPASDFPNVSPAQKATTIKYTTELFTSLHCFVCVYSFLLPLLFLWLLVNCTVLVYSTFLFMTCIYVCFMVHFPEPLLSVCVCFTHRLKRSLVARCIGQVRSIDDDSAKTISSIRGKCAKAFFPEKVYILVLISKQMYQTWPKSRPKWFYKVLALSTVCS